MLGCKKIVLLTGARINEVSGIRNPQDPGHYYFDPTRFAGLDKPEQIISSSNFKENPVSVWNFVYDTISEIE